MDIDGSLSARTSSPAMIDPEDRRTELATIAANLIGKDGMRAATIRNVAAEAGYSTKIVTHYFADKSELLFRVHYDAAMRAQQRFDAAFANDPCDIQGGLEAFLPLNRDTIRDWKIFVASWDAAFSEGIFLDRQRYWLRNARDLIRNILLARRGAGLDTHNDPDEAPRLLMIVQGIATQAVFGERMWSPRNQVRILADELRRI
jgi:AcrR family transcriptional regulator